MVKEIKKDKVDEQVAEQLLSLTRDFSELVKNQKSNRKDGFYNSLTGLGTSADKRMYGGYNTGFSFISDSELEAMYHTSDFARTIVSKIIDDALRLQPIFYKASKSGEKKQIDLSQLNKWEIIKNIQEAATWGRLYGCGGILLVTDEQDLSKPFPEQLKQGQLKAIIPIDKQNLTPKEYYNISDIIDGNAQIIGEPKIYSLSFNTSYGGQSSAVTVHASRLILFGGAMTSQRVKAKHSGCDLSVLQAVYDVLRDFDNIWSSVQVMLQDASQGVLKVKNLSAMIAMNKNTVLEKALLVNQARSVSNLLIIDSELEDFSYVGSINLTGMEPLITKSLERIASAAQMPATLLLGNSPDGLNATGESDRIFWYNTVQAYQQTVLKSAFIKLMTLILQSEGMLSKNDEVEIEFPALENSIIDPTDLQNFDIFITLKSQVQKGDTPKDFAINLLSLAFPSREKQEFEQLFESLDLTNSNLMTSGSI